MRWLVVIAATTACSSGKPKQVEDAASGAGAASGADPASGAEPASGAGTDAGTASAASVEQTTGDVQIRVEWPTMPRAARVSPGASACGTPLAAQVAPTTTWGIPDVVVFVDGAPSAPSSSASSVPRISIDRCGVAPRISLGSRIAIASAADQPLRASLTKRFGVGELKRALTSAAIPIALPITGHEVTAELDAGSIYRVAPDGKHVDDSWIIGATAFLTDATGVALIKDVPPGKHAVRVWLPPRGGQPAREARGEVTVAVADLAELTLTLK